MISVVLATHNEEKNISACLESVKSFAEEIIIADGESTDDTLEIAKKYKTIIINTTNKQNFHINKQIAMDRANGDLVLQMDADEIVDQELVEFIKRVHNDILKKNYSGSSAWWIRRKNWFLGKFLTKGGQYPDPVIRLYMKGKAKLPQKDVHEQMVVDGEVGWAGGHLLHYGNPDFSTYLRKWNDYTSLRATQLQENGEKISILNFFNYFFAKSSWTFLNIFIRHKGLVDGLPGFIFALFSGLYFPFTYLKLWELNQK